MVSGSATSQRGELLLELLEHVEHRRGGQALEVVDAVAGLVDGLGSLDPELVGLPEQVDRRLQPATTSRRVLLLEQSRDRAQLVQRRAPGDLGRVRGEHRAHRDRGRPRRDVLGLDAGSPDAAQRAGSGPPSAARRSSSARPRCSCSVTLARWKYAVNARASMVAVSRSSSGSDEGIVLRGIADALHEVEQVLAVDPGQGVAQHRGDDPDVVAQRRFGGAGAGARTWGPRSGVRRFRTRWAGVVGGTPSGHEPIASRADQ